MNKTNTLFLATILVIALIANVSSKNFLKARKDDSTTTVSATALTSADATPNTKVEDLKNQLHDLKKASEATRNPKFLKKEFETFDTNKNKKLDKAELTELLNALAIKTGSPAPTEESINTFFTNADRKKSGSISFGQFVVELRVTIEKEVHNLLKQLKAAEKQEHENRKAAEKEKMQSEEPAVKPVESTTDVKPETS